MACGVNYPYIHSNNFEMNRFFFLLIRFEVNQSSHLCYALPNLIRDWRYLMLPNTTRNAFSQWLIDWSLNFKKKTNKQKTKLVIHRSGQGRSWTIQMGFSQCWWFLELFAYKSGHKKSIDCILFNKVRIRV